MSLPPPARWLFADVHHLEGVAMSSQEDKSAMSRLNALT
jgi:hypothetical protein